MTIATHAPARTTGGRSARASHPASEARAAARGGTGAGIGGSSTFAMKVPVAVPDGGRIPKYGTTGSPAGKATAGVSGVLCGGPAS